MNADSIGQDKEIKSILNPQNIVTARLSGHTER